MKHQQSNIRIIDRQVVDIDTGEVLSQYDVYINDLGIIKYRAKRKYVKKHKKSVEGIIVNINNDVKKKGHKSICVFYRTMDYLNVNHIEVKKEYLTLISNLLGYKEAWVDFKMRELITNK